MNSFALWVAESPLSQFIQQTLWVVPWIQIIHICAIAVVMSSIFMIDLRILNLTGHNQTMTQTARRFLPWLWSGLVVLAISGSVLIIGEPVRSLDNAAFWIKMSLLLIGIVTTLWFQSTLHRNMAFWEENHERRQFVRVLAVASFLVWVGIAVAGRWIAYSYVPNL